MAITVNYAPDASALGQAGFMAGRGEYATDERRYRDKMSLAVEELIQQERMQGRQIAASRANTRDQIVGNLAGRQMGIAADEREMVFDERARRRQQAFDFVADRRDRFQQARLKSMLGTQQALQQNWLYGQSDQRQMQMEQFQNQLELQQIQTEADERLQLAQQQAEAKRQAIFGTMRKNIEAARQAMASGRLMPAEGQNYIARLQAEANQLASGVDWESEFPEGMTPKQELNQQWEQGVIETPYGPMQLDPESGTFEAPRGFQQPEPSQEEQQRIDAAKAQQDMEIRQREMIAEMEEKKLDYELKIFDSLMKQMKPPSSGPDGKPKAPEPLYDPETAIKMARERSEAAFAGRIPELEPPEQAPPAAPPVQGQMAVPPGDVPAGPQGPAPGGAPAQPQEAAPDPTYGSDWVPDVDPETGENLPAQVRTDDYAYDREVSPDVSPEDRAPIERFYDITQVGKRSDPQLRPPSNMTLSELNNVGSHVMGGNFDIGSEAPESSRPVLTGLKHVGGAANWHDKELGALRRVAGAYAAYGPDVARWPKAVLAETVADRAIVKAMVRGPEGGE